MIDDSDPSPRWAAYSHEEILAMVRAGPGAAASQYAAGRWEATWFTVSLIEANLARAITEAGSGWAGPAAEAMAAGTTPLGQWAGQAAVQAQNTAKTVEAQAGYADYTRREMPPLPHPEIPTHPVRSPRPYMSGVPIMTDWAAVERDRDAATARARDLMVTYGRNSYDTLPGLLESQAPPSVVVQNTATGAVQPAGAAAASSPAASRGPGVPPVARNSSGAEVRAGPAGGPRTPVARPPGSWPSGTAQAGSTPGGSTPSASGPGASRPGPSGSRRSDSGSGVGAVPPGPYGNSAGRQAGPGRGGPGPEPPIPGRSTGTFPHGPADPGSPSSPGSDTRRAPGPLSDPSTGRPLPGSGLPTGGTAPHSASGPWSLGDPVGAPSHSTGSLADPGAGGVAGRAAGSPLPEPAVLDRGSPERPFPSSAPPTGRAGAEGLMPMGAGGMGRAHGEEHRRPPYLVDDGSAFADDRPIPGPVINEECPRA